MPDSCSNPNTSNFPNDVQIEEGKPSYKDITSNNLPTIEIPIDLVLSGDENGHLDDDMINLSIGDKRRLYAS